MKPQSLAAVASNPTEPTAAAAAEPILTASSGPAGVAADGPGVGGNVSFTDDSEANSKFSLTAGGHDAQGAFTLTESGNVTLTYHEEGGSAGVGNWTFDQAGSVSYTFTHDGQPDRTGTQVIDVHERGQSGSGPTGFDLTGFNAGQFFGVGSDVTFTAHASGSENQHFHESGSGSGADSFTVDNQVQKGFGTDDSGEEDITADGKDDVEHFDETDTDGETLTFTDTGSVSTDGGSANYTMTDAVTDGDSDKEDGTETDRHGVETESETVDETGGGTECFSFTESGTQNLAGATTSFTLTQGASGSFSTTDDGTEHHGPDGSGTTDDFTLGGGGGESFSLRETGTITTPTGNASFTYNEGSGDTYSDHDAGAEADANGAAVSESDTDHGHDGGTGGVTFSLTGSDTSGGVAVRFTEGTSDHDQYTDTDTDTDAEALANGVVSEDDNDDATDTGDETDNVSENGTITTPTSSVSFTVTLDDSDHYNDDEDDEYVRNASGWSNVDGFEETDGGTETVTDNETGTLNGAWGNSAFTYTDTVGEHFHETDDGTDDTASTAGETLDEDFDESDGGSESFNLTQSGLFRSSVGTATFTSSDVGSDTVSSDDDGSLDNSPGRTYRHDDLDGEDDGGETVTLDMKGGVTSPDGHGGGSFTFHDAAKESYGEEQAEHDTTTNGATTGSGTFDGSDSDSETITLNENGAVNNGSGGGLTFTIDESEGDGLSGSDDGSDTVGGPAAGETDHVITHDTGNETASVTEGGSASVPGISGSFTLNESENDHYKFDGDEDDTTGPSGPTSSGTVDQHDDGTETTGLHENGTVNQGLVTGGTFKYDDDAADSYSLDDESFGGAATGDGFTETFHGGETSSFHENGGLTQNQNGYTLSGTFNLDDTAAANTGGGDNGTASSGPTGAARTDHFNGTDKAKLTHALAIGGTITDSRGRTYKGKYGESDNAKSDVGGNGTETSRGGSGGGGRDQAPRTAPARRAKRWTKR